MKTKYVRAEDNTFVEEGFYKRNKAVDALKRAMSLPKKTFDHFKGKIQRVNEIRRERDRQMQEELDVRMRPKEKDPNYITVSPPRRQEVMSVGRKITKF